MIRIFPLKMICFLKFCFSQYFQIDFILFLVQVLQRNERTVDRCNNQKKTMGSLKIKRYNQVGIKFRKTQFWRVRVKYWRV